MSETVTVSSAPSRSRPGPDSPGRSPAPVPGLDASVRVERGVFVLEADLAVEAGITALFGPSGAGKSTLLRVLAGLEPEAHGTIQVSGQRWLSPGERGGVPPHRRAVGFVFQEANLLPHLSVEGNLAYGARRADGSGPSRDDVVRWLQLAPLLARRPDGLSGGERQRVALGRALLRGPRLLLLDEPLSSLDGPARAELMEVLETLPLRHSIPILLVTHELDEVLRLAPHMVWLDEGRVRAAGPTSRVMARTDFVRWRGHDAGVVAAGRVIRHDDDHLTTVRGPWGDLALPGRLGSTDARLRFRVLARDVSLALAREENSTLVNQLYVRIRAVEELAPGECLVRMVSEKGRSKPDTAEPELLARVTRRSVGRLGLGPGRRVWARVKSVAVVGAP